MDQHCQASEIALTTISHIETGVRKVNVSTLIKYHNYFGVSMDFLILGGNPAMSVEMKDAVLQLADKIRAEQDAEDLNA